MLYLCAVTVHEFSVLFRTELNRIYPGGEVDAVWKWFLAERLPEQVDPLRRDSAAVIDDALLVVMKSELERLLSGEPLQYVMGHAFFFGMRLAVDSRVLIPRPETEEMLEWIRSQSGFEPSTIVDVCTGSGCIALGLKKSFPSATVVALDVSEKALEIANQNANSNGLEVEWKVKDVLKEGWSDGLPQQTQLVVSNPPYILQSESHAMHSSVLEHEPSIALFVPEDDPLLFYRVVANYARKTLVPGGQLWFEINPLQYAQMVVMIREYGFASVEIINDLSGKARFAKAIG